MRETLLGIALVAVATGIFKLLCPDSGFKKQIGFLVAAFFLLSCASLLKKSNMSFGEISDSFRYEGAYVDFSAEAYRMTQNELAARTAAALKEKLSQEKILCDEIRVVIDISFSYSISIKQVRLAFSLENSGYAAAAEELVKKEVGDQIEIITEIKGH